MQKELYDFILQYPTGQIEIFDKDKFQSKSISPLYRDVSIVVLTTKQTLMNMQKKGYKLLENVGITYQN
jgi:hypothetical protein